MTEKQTNTLSLVARIAEAESLRFTPAGLPAINLLLEHSSQAEEAGQKREVVLKIKAVAFGTVSERLARQEIGSNWKFTGFLNSTASGKSVVFHIQDFLQD